MGAESRLRLAGHRLDRGHPAAAVREGVLREVGDRQGGLEQRGPARAAWRSWGDLFAGGDAARRGAEADFREADEGCSTPIRLFAWSTGASFRWPTGNRRTSPTSASPTSCSPGRAGSPRPTKCPGTSPRCSTRPRSPTAHGIPRHGVSAGDLGQNRPSRTTAAFFRANSEVPSACGPSDGSPGGSPRQLDVPRELCLDASDAMPPRMRSPSSTPPWPTSATPAGPGRAAEPPGRVADRAPGRHGYRLAGRRLHTVVRLVPQRATFAPSRRPARTAGSDAAP